MSAVAWDSIARAISAATGRRFSIEHRRDVGGGCINNASIVTGGGESYFIKINDADREWMFEAEAAGLEELAATDTIRVPRPICAGASGTFAWLALEHVDLKKRDSESDALLGGALAKLHRATARQFGWHRANTIGSTPQQNTWMDSWPVFWRDMRLLPQLELAHRNGYRGALESDGANLLAKIGRFFESYEPRPSLLHGDLWSGNAESDARGSPVLFDPAVYYGDREADLAMTELFGGFTAAFYSAYDEAFPRDEGYRTRRDLYNLYHVLNHLNLFGGSYLIQAERIIERLLSA